MIKKLPRAPMRPEKEPGAETEIWQPEWKCFCCHDSGILVPHLAERIIDGYDCSLDKIPLCANPGCKAASKYNSEFWDASVDRRIEPAVCQQLDLLEREAWRKTIQVKAQKIQEAIKAFASQKSLRKRDRSPEEEQLIRKRHHLVTQEDWGLVAATEAEDKWFAGWEGEG